MDDSFSSRRHDRLKSLFTREISRLISLIKDPLVEGGGIQIVDFVLSPDLFSARIYISVLDKDREVPLVSLLQKQSHWIRGQMGKRLRLKKIPKFFFLQDDTEEKNSYVNALLEKIRQNEHHTESES